MTSYRVVIRTPGGNLEFLLEAISDGIAREASGRVCLPGCRVASVDGDDVAVTSGSGPGPRKPPLQAHTRPPENEQV